MILPEIDNLRELKSGADKTSYEQKNNRITVKDVARKAGFPPRRLAGRWEVTAMSARSCVKKSCALPKSWAMWQTR
jgi:hypothetical protein